jgi:hypothetical protein
MRSSAHADGVWYPLRKREQSLVIEGQAVIAKADEIAAKLPDMDSWSGTQGWLQGFKNRKGIRNFKLHGEARSADLEGLTLARGVLHCWIEDEVTTSRLCSSVKKM